MTAQLKVVGVLVGIILFIYIIELVRRRDLREEFAWLWLVTGIVIVALSLWYDLLVFISDMLGGVVPSAVLFFFGMIFLLLICLYQSVKISKLTDQMKRLTQELALMNLSSRSGFKDDSEKSVGNPGPQ